MGQIFYQKRLQRPKGKPNLNPPPRLNRVIRRLLNRRPLQRPCRPPYWRPSNVRRELCHFPRWRLWREVGAYLILTLMPSLIQNSCCIMEICIMELKNKAICYLHARLIRRLSSVHNTFSWSSFHTNSESKNFHVLNRSCMRLTVQKFQAIILGKIFHCIHETSHNFTKIHLGICRTTLHKELFTISYRTVLITRICEWHVLCTLLWLQPKE
jgi:hypothetical protein